MTLPCAAIFSSSQEDQCIRAWCPRSSTSVYELSTGNLDIKQMSWNKPKQSLFTRGESSIRTSNSYDDENYGGDSEDDGESAWPKEAKHAATAFGLRWSEKNPSCVVWVLHSGFSVAVVVPWLRRYDFSEMEPKQGRI